MNAPRLVIGDGHLGIWSALARVFPESEGQRCWNHRMRNILDCVSLKSQPEAKELLRKVMNAESLDKACAAKATFQKWAAERQVKILVKQKVETLLTNQGLTQYVLISGIV